MSNGAQFASGTSPTAQAMWLRWKANVPGLSIHERHTLLEDAKACEATIKKTPRGA
jgi:hypothetical protein